MSEVSYYGPLEALLNEVGKGLKPKVTGAGGDLSANYQLLSGLIVDALKAGDFRDRFCHPLLLS